MAASDDRDTPSAAQPTPIAVQQDTMLIILHLVPLQTPVATEFVLDSTNELWVFRYEPSRLIITEVRHGEVSDQLMLSKLRSELDGVITRSTAAGTIRPRPLEGDQFYLMVCHRLASCGIAAGTVATFPGLKAAIKSLSSVDGLTPVREPASYLRCIAVSDRQWASIELRQTYALHEMETLLATARTAIHRSVSLASRFHSLSLQEAKTIGAQIHRQQIFVRHESGIFGCELYTAD